MLYYITIKSKKDNNMNIAIPITGPNRCIGDVNHNYLCGLIITACPKEISGKVFSLIETECDKREFRWIQNLFSKTEINKLCTLLKSKSIKTLLKRELNLLNYFTRNPFQTILNKEKIAILRTTTQLLQTNLQ